MNIEHENLTLCNYKPSSWSDTRELMYNLSSWIFRGQSDSSWSLNTTLNRASLDSSCDIRKIPELESKILKLFQRRAPQYLSNLPDKDNYLEWYSLIQHHGGPTRLLDFTHSFYVACFFALERNNKNAAIYCINRPLLHSTGQQRESDRGYQRKLEFGTVEYCNQILKEQTSSPLVMISEPFNMNERLAAQQELFVIPFEGQQSFEYNLSLTLDPFLKNLPDMTSLLSWKSNLDILNNKCGMLKIILDKSMYKEIKKDLHLMNINAATLFPGLDGFTQSLYSQFDLFDD